VLREKGFEVPFFKALNIERVSIRFFQKLIFVNAVEKPVKIPRKENVKPNFNFAKWQTVIHRKATVFCKTKIGRREAKSEYNSAEQKSRNAIEKNPSKSREKQTDLIEK
jgi:hypothetical protein